MIELLKKTLIRYDKVHIQITFILVLYLFTTLIIWRKYEWHPTSMVHFGNEFVELNLEYMPSEAIVEKGYDGDLGAGYDGQIFYFYSRSLNSFPLKWPLGFEEEYRAPRIGYPFLSAIFGILGPSGTIFGMYFWNITLFIISAVLLRKILGEYSYLVWFYILSPFSLGSYSVLVSDSIMISLVIVSYYFYLKDKYILFILSASLAILTKEPALFFFFPLGLYELGKKNLKKIISVLLILLIPITWYIYLRTANPNWKSGRIFEFIVPFDGILTYLNNLLMLVGGNDWREIARAFSRFPLLIILLFGVYSTFAGDFKKGFIFRMGLIFNFLMVIFGSYYHFWSVYENVSRMFALSVPLMVLLSAEDGVEKRKYYFYMILLIFILFILRLSVIQKPMEHFLWIL